MKHVDVRILITGNYEATILETGDTGEGRETGHAVGIVLAKLMSRSWETESVYQLSPVAQWNRWSAAKPILEYDLGFTTTNLKVTATVRLES